MIFVAIAALTLAGVCVIGAFGIVRWLWRTLERANRAHEQQIEMLLDRMMHAVNKTWTPPPYARDDPDARREPDPYEGIIADPSQTIDYPGSVMDELDRQMARDANEALSRPSRYESHDLDEVT